MTGSNVTLIAGTDEPTSRLVVFVDNGSTATASVIGAAPANTGYRGIALTPHR